MAKRNWTVTLPIGGHAYVDVVAETEKEAIEKAQEAVTVHDIDTWETLPEVNRGNLCLFPTPWSASAEDNGEADAEAEGAEK